MSTSEVTMPAKAEVESVLLPFKCLLALTEIGTCLRSKRQKEKADAPLSEEATLPKRSAILMATQCLGCRSLCGLRGRRDCHWSCLLSLGLDDAEKLPKALLAYVVTLPLFIVLHRLVNSSTVICSLPNVERSLACIGAVSSD